MLNMGQGDKLTQQTLMVVDDCSSNLRAMHGLFQAEYQVVIFNNATDALNYAADNSVDLTLLDVDMPGMSGWEVCRELKGKQATKDVAVIYVTAARSAYDEQRGLRLGAVDYVAKPINLAVLRARVRNHMQLVSYRKELEALSNFDGLTGVSNRRRLDEALEHHYAASRRLGYGLATLMIDVDDFKFYNDTYGHIAGDRCLRRIAKTLMSARRRETDVVGRYGGEEFAIVLPDTDLDGGLLFAERLLDLIRQLEPTEKRESASPEIDSLEAKVTVSIGLSVLPPGDRQLQRPSLHEFLCEVDEQLYRAKRNGKNRVCFPSHDMEQKGERIHFHRN